MPQGYWVGRVDVIKPEGYQAYGVALAVRPAAASAGARALACRLRQTSLYVARIDARLSRFFAPFV